MCFPSPGSRGRNLTDLPPRSISTGVYVGIHISQGKIHYVPFVLALRKNRIRESDVDHFLFLLQKKLVFRMYLGKRAAEIELENKLDCMCSTLLACQMKIN